MYHLFKEFFKGLSIMMIKIWSKKFIKMISLDLSLRDREMVNADLELAIHTRGDKSLEIGGVSNAANYSIVNLFLVFNHKP